MTEMLDRIRETALALPEVEERPVDGQPTFFVADRQFAQVRADRDGHVVLCVRTGGDGPDAELDEVALDGDVDWLLVDDRIARSWELAAPARLLEAGGR